MLHNGNFLFRRLLERLIALFLAVGILIYANSGRLSGGIERFLLLRVTVFNVIGAFVFVWAWELCFEDLSLEGLESGSMWRNVGKVVKGCSCVTCVFALLLVAARVHTALSMVLPLFWISSVLLISTRLSIDSFLETSPWVQQSRVLILGTGPMAHRAWRELRTRYHNKLKVIGFVDDHLFHTAAPEVRSKYIGSVDQVELILLREVVDTIVIAMPVRSCHASIQRVIEAGQDVGVDFLQFDAIFQFADNQGIRPVSLLRSYSHACSRFALRQIAKRVIDIMVSLVALVLLSPLLLSIGLAVKSTSSGPALFVQERYGFRRRRFRLFKFRTMVIDAEQRMSELEQHNEAVGPIFKIKRDPRVTPLGRWLRKTSLDELPQLWNVLIGDMSLVGPRPMSLRDVSLFNRPSLMRRFRVKPGITGLWQVSGRSNVSFERWIALDFRYIDNWSLLLDFQILLRTFPAVLKGSGAM